ncbi:hypothetical protein TTE1119 [Caldanaerobacter subterraneus subsp. tengcongensis MB4]|uniref:Uncharacterized protein n=1 Tax=Caldanaerobacter subterraneus subsp. tengcongensis (strain DSM 15242 / JCM 11007 / NBRC 100824 / MB4) TaxID=273068 RepID=Q8RAT2_CALS4|nr:hypothetical protein TTE1119 [Caldanaerobacter subterraneus subsp. tengcongensis MB4]
MPLSISFKTLKISKKSTFLTSNSGSLGFFVETLSLFCPSLLAKFILKTFIQIFLASESTYNLKFSNFTKNILVSIFREITSSSFLVSSLILRGEKYIKKLKNKKLKNRERKHKIFHYFTSIHFDFPLPK